MSFSHSPRLTGLVQALSAYLIWIVFPLYFALLHAVSPLEIVAWRMLCTLPFCLIMVAVLRQGKDLREVLSSPRLIGALVVSGLLIGANWTAYVIAVMHGHVLAASLGYYINPLLNIFTGALFLRERLSRLQWLAVALAAIGVGMLALDALPTLWISMTIALAFSGYALTRKLAPVSALPGLTVETMVLQIPALGLLGWQAASPAGISMGASASLSLLLAGSGVLTGIPLILFAAAARRLNFSLLGFIQFLTPTGLFLISLLVFHEPFKPVQIICFVFIWTAIALFCWDLLSRRTPAA